MQASNDDEVISLSTMGCNPRLQVCKDSIVEDGCTDIEPQNTPFSCQEVSQLEICSGLQQEYCKKSCRRCCTDVVLPGMANCGVVLQAGICDSPQVFGIYCRKSCGHCTEERSIFENVCSPAQAISCDVQALLKFKNSLTRGAETLSNWVGEDPCTWNYITCTNVDGQHYRVEEILIDDDNIDYTMSGTLVPEFSNLRYLARFEIDSQNLFGPLPEEYSVLDKLTKFAVLRTDNTGTLPAVYSLWSGIKKFIVASTDIGGAIPVEYSVFDLLKTFFVWGNQGLSGTLPPQFSVLTNLEKFEASQCALTGTIPVYRSQAPLIQHPLYDNDVLQCIPYGECIYQISTSFFDYCVQDQQFWQGWGDLTRQNKVRLQSCGIFFVSLLINID
eukprot:TRINITY_DN38313_c0_g1_i1.p1 TRINITY_DN38313_c0_g1~~TRINITY_DN38313_c0_g1_i1.p1  ORF type:complete len:452 (+),score=19.45 TRINITY_DN38313_c0_g1_i1:198-1358(+)